MRRTCGGDLTCFGLIVLCVLLALTATEAQPPAPLSAPGVPAGDGTYVVKKGDTLWGIAKDLLNDPILWPRILDRNPFIADPNLIYPGDTLAVPGKEVAPAPVAEVPTPEPLKEAPKEEVKAPPPPPPAPPAVAEEGLPSLPPAPPASQQAIACSPIVFEEGAIAAKAGIGNIVQTDDNRLLLSQENQVFVGFDGAQSLNVGDRLAVMRSGARVIHPRSRQSLGRALLTLGVLEITEVRERTVRARIIYSCDAINVGDRVAPFVLAPFPEDRIAQPTTRKVEGTIVDAARPVDVFALQQLVYLDVGRNQGVGPGDVFAIYQVNVPVLNPATGQEVPIPPLRRGEAVVIRVTDRTATAVISASAKEIEAGDLVVLSRQIQPQ